jgi:hypothetical protein
MLDEGRIVESEIICHKRIKFITNWYLTPIQNTLRYHNCTEQRNQIIVHMANK